MVRQSGLHGATWDRQAAAVARNRARTCQVFEPTWQVRVAAKHDTYNQTASCKLPPIVLLLAQSFCFSRVPAWAIILLPLLSLPPPATPASLRLKP
jgi:hypothetical protein